MVARIVNERLHLLVFVEGDAHVDDAVGQTQMREASGAGFFAFPFLRMHEEHEVRARRHGPDRGTPAKRLGPEATVTGFAAHDVWSRVARCAASQASAPASSPNAPSSWAS